MLLCHCEDRRKSWYSSFSELDLYPRVFLRVLAGELVDRLQVPTSIYSLRRWSCLAKMTESLIKGIINQRVDIDPRCLGIVGCACVYHHCGASLRPIVLAKYCAN